MRCRAQSWASNTPIQFCQARAGRIPCWASGVAPAVGLTTLSTRSDIPTRQLQCWGTLSGHWDCSGRQLGLSVTMVKADLGTCTLRGDTHGLVRHPSHTPEKMGDMRV